MLVIHHISLLLASCFVVYFLIEHRKCGLPSVSPYGFFIHVTLYHMSSRLTSTYIKSSSRPFFSFLSFFFNNSALSMSPLFSNNSKVSFCRKSIKLLYKFWNTFPVSSKSQALCVGYFVACYQGRRDRTEGEAWAKAPLGCLLVITSHQSGVRLSAGCSFQFA